MSSTIIEAVAFIMVESVLMQKYNKVIILNKKEGETPLGALECFRTRHKSYNGLPMTYAGRLDPMASGVLLVLVGEEIKNKEKYLKLDKEYEFSVLFGFATDTYDILGKCVKQGLAQDLILNLLEKNIKNNLKYFKGKLIQKYPMYSSKTVKGKPLFVYARSGENVEIPEREVSVKNLKFLKLRKINAKKLLENIEKRIAKVGGDFRQKEILKIWKDNLKNKKENYFIADLKIKCSSGTYVRVVANDLGERMQIPAIAFSIKRTKVGRFSL